ncbi:hypothetical protein SAMN05720606_11849 [Paenibacillus polysaccharolyticus]|uniref:EVE domain-containing protein n=1 Tax=Paenibacillus polysaccharolyticus TaxID=582692 RepID=A0A1G5L0E9_9BACL|nr:hypothetical protein [Paenibacillus polysaccharolyticus]SCZ05901.1 hypothetical protein SAMN05720606_11849 [Paenibacillus polysaccharolyticus]
MPKVYIINTNKSNNPQAENDMISNMKCSAYYSPWKHYIDTIEANDIVYLYSSGVGIIARGIATGIVEIKDYIGKENEEHYMYLNRFEKLSTPLTADKITNILTEATIDKTEYKIQWNQTMILIAYSLGLKVWQVITKKYI